MGVAILRETRVLVLVRAERAMQVLFSGPVLPRLRRLATGDAWMDSDRSLTALIAAADKLPALEELILLNGRISMAGFRSLAEAGRRGCWPLLKRFEIEKIAGEEDMENLVAVKERCIALVQEVWPGLEVTVSGG